MRQEEFNFSFCELKSRLEILGCIGMYEFGHASDAFLNGLALKLRSMGWTDEEIIGAFVSRTMRKWLDSEDGPREEIMKIGRKYAKSLALFGSADHNHIEVGSKAIQKSKEPEPVVADKE